MKIVFFGSPNLAVESLKKILEAGYEVVAVVTAPDKPAGRGMKLKPTAVKEFAQDKGIPVLQPHNLKDEEFLEKLRAAGADVFVVVAFRYLPKQVWSIPPLGTINLHTSYLPDYRGAAPINWAVVNGETQTGVTTFYINDNLDTGNIILRKRVPIYPEDTAGDLHDRLMTQGADLLVETLRLIESGKATPIPQADLEKEFNQLKTAPKLTQENTRIDWNNSAQAVYNFIRGMSPYPGAWTTLVDDEKGKKTPNVKIFRATAIEDNHNLPSGTIVTDKKTFFKVAVPDGFVEIKEIQLPGKKRLPIEEFLKGFKAGKAHFE